MQGETQNLSVETASLVSNLEKDLNLFAAFATPEIVYFSYPPLFLAVWEWLIEYATKGRVFPKLALGLPRGFGKTTLMKLFVVWLILFSKKNFILVVSSTAEHANNFLSDVKDILCHHNILTVFGDWRVHLEKNTEDHTRFHFRGRDIILKGIGRGGSARGINVKNRRPDFILLEDAQTREDADSEKVSLDLYKWMLGTLMKAKSPFGTMTVFVANMYPTPHSILKKLKKNPDWIKFIAAGLDSQMRSIWEDLQPAEQLIAEYKADRDAGHPEIFAAEVLNDENIQANNIIDLSKLKDIPYSEQDIPLYKFIIIDPAGRKKKSDNTAIGYFEAIDPAIPYFKDVRNCIMSPGEQVRTAIELAIETGTYAIGVESVAYQSSLLFWIEHFTQELGISGIKFFEIPTGRLSKEARIIKMLRSYAAGEMYVAEQIKPIVHNEIISFDPTRTDNVDNILDVMTMSHKLIEIAGGDLIPPDLLDARESPAELVDADIS